MIKVLKLSLAVGVIGVMFAGCGTTHSTSISIPHKSDTENNINIYMDQSSSALPFSFGKVARENFQYALGAAAHQTIKSGHKYFRISAPENLGDLMKKQGVKSVENMYEVCDKGENSFAYSFTYRHLATDLGSENINICDNITRRYTDDGIRSFSHNTIRFNIQTSNQYVENMGYVNAEDVLKSEMIKNLNKEYFESMNR